MISDDLREAIVEWLTTTRLSHAEIAKRLKCGEQHVRKVWLESGQDDARPAPSITLPSLKPPQKVGIAVVKEVVSAYFEWPTEMPTSLAHRLGLSPDTVRQVFRQERLPYRGSLYKEDK